ncbi:MAG: RluA family pseudouridine synthase [Deltaproteobacteria bacterium]|nr:MAG: RluA family pseudouridine synthase [Deltaproteobacteria bacterium]
MTEVHRPRELEVPEAGAGLRLDRYLARWFSAWSRSALSREIRQGLVTDPEGRPLRGSHTVRAGERILIWIPGIAATTAPPPFPPILHEDDRLIAVNKPPGMMCHPAGSRFVYALIGLAKERWPRADVDLIHRIDAHTSGIVLLSRDVEANRFVKSQLHADHTLKIYDAIVRGQPSWTHRELRQPIGPAGGIVRIQMAARQDGLPSLTRAEVVATQSSPLGPISRVRCIIETGRTHQIRVHLSDVGHPLVGDRLYSGRPELFLDVRERGLTETLIREAGAPRHALHASELKIPHPDGGWLEIRAPLAADMQRWWDRPDVLPLDVASNVKVG